MLIRRREKVFEQTNAIPLDRNAKCRIAVYTRAWSARNKQPRQHHGPITMAFQRVLEALLWGFHNSKDGRCFPSYDAIAIKAGCARSTIAAALKALEWAGVLTWQHRIVRIRERCHDLLGADGWRWRVIRTSNAYAFVDPLASKSENRPGTQNQDLISLPLVRTAPPKARSQVEPLVPLVPPDDRQAAQAALKAARERPGLLAALMEGRHATTATV